jgi:putative ABC transport system ATP-binding protein
MGNLNGNERKRDELAPCILPIVPLLAADMVSLAYFDGDRTTYALQEVSVSVPPNEFIGIMGPSGSGKSSLLYILSGLKRPTSGDVWFESARINEMTDARVTELRRDRFGFVFQQPWLLPWQTALENTIMGSPKMDRSAEAAAIAHLEQLGVGRLANKLPSQLSGGEKQRVCVARAMMNNPAVIFADEPTASLDQRNGHLVIDLLSAYKERGTVIIVTHDAEMLATADRVLVMRDGRAVDWVTPDELKSSRSLTG